ncbi:MAG: phosphotransferase family protein [Actinomycetota bacterium]|nr:phosphotransferase family protein [Actinomycetota bacterium]
MAEKSSVHQIGLAQVPPLFSDRNKKLSEVPMSQPEFFEALEQVVLREIPGCTALVAVERLSGGASMETYRLVIRSAAGDQRLCMRRGAGGVDRDNVSAIGLAAESLLMRTARTHGVAEPEVYYDLKAEDAVGVGFIMEWLDGETLGARIVRSPELEQVRPRLAEQCGRELAKIHAIDVDQSGLRGHLPTLSPEEYLEQTWERYREWDTAQPMIDFTGMWLRQHLPEQHDVALVHNDFRNGNLMIDHEKGLVAVLDWETSHIGDPIRDLGWICTNSWRFGRRDLEVGGFGIIDDLIFGYEDESGKAVDRDALKFWEVFGSFWWAIGCLGMTDQYRNGPDATVERPAIGRRSSECQVDCVNLLIPGAVELIEPEPLSRPSDMPRVDELLTSVRDFLHGEVMSSTTGRTNFLARVAGNSLDIVDRELAIGPELRRREEARLADLLQRPGSFDQLRWSLVEALRDGSMSLDRQDLHQYLRESVVNQVSIDQPKYSGFRFAATNT